MIIPEIYLINICLSQKIFTFTKKLLITKSKINMKKLLFFAAAIAFAALTSCSGGGKTNGSTDSTKTKDSTAAKAPVSGGRYKMKSGMLEQTLTTMMMTQHVTIYFDDYGNKQSKETKSDMGMDNLSITKDGFVYDIDLIKKIGKKIKIPSTGDVKNINYSQLSEDMMKQMKITKLGTEDVLGKTCDKYSIDDAAMKMKVTNWVWNGIPLKSESEMTAMGMGIKTTIITTKIDENAAVPADKFEIPAGIKLTDFGK